ncbi:MAG: hypothetical protein LBG76_10005 [Treponema sp.]|jgi:outer membrane protein assembly factor BamD (BamD/ComL family)|nr:hypothetical protein [Treponema sp.]
MRKIVWGVFALFIIGCASGAVQLSQDMSPEELMQRGQEAADRNRYGVALRYYTEIRERFSSNMSMVCAAEYEIAHVHYKQKKYDLAKDELNALLARYDGSDAELLPPQFKRLCAIVLGRIDEKEQSQERVKNFFKNPFGTPKKS